MRSIRRGTRGLVAVSAAMSVAAAILPQQAQAAPAPRAPALAAAVADDPLPEATPDEKYKAALVVNAGDDLNMQAKQDCDFVHEVSLRAIGAELNRAAVAAFAAGTVTGGSASACTLFIREGLFEANLRDQDIQQRERAERDARQAAAAAISLEATPRLLAMSNYDFVAQIIVFAAPGTRVKTQAEAAVRSDDPQQLSAFLTVGIFAAHRQDQIDAIDADGAKSEAEKEVARWRAAKARALAVLGIVATDGQLVLDDTNFVLLISTKAPAGSEVAAAAAEALGSFDPLLRKAFIETGIYESNQRDVTKALQKQAEENRTEARVILAKAQNSLVHPALVTAATAALAGSDTDISAFLRNGRYAVLSQTLRTVTPGRAGWYLRGAAAGTSVAAEGTGTAKALTDATWKVDTGLGDADCHSLESVSSPGYYLRESGYRVLLAANDGSDAFKTSATWCASAGKSGADVSLESKTKPGRFLRHLGNELWAAQSGMANDFDRPCNFNTNASWKFGDPTAPALTDKGTGEMCGDVAAVTVGTPDHFLQNRDDSKLFYGQVKATKLEAQTAPAFSNWANIGEIAGGNVNGATAGDSGCKTCPPPPIETLDDLMVIERSTGKLWLYPDVKRGAGARQAFGSSGWNGMRELTVGNFCQQSLRVKDVAAVVRSTGKLYCYPSNEDSLGTKREIGTGTSWNNMDKLAAGNMGVGTDLMDDLFAVERSTGTAYVYPDKEGGGLGTKIKIGAGWNGFASIAVGEFNNAGYADIIAIEPSGRKWLYPGNGGGKFAARIGLS
ncbi:AbfB domain-containing protein [Actinoplanes sp. ATCC 53533]|uniref:AbfB domain-containing protein n=1 Tax=Actinoplanes sp. ATCC 53533 TaxID=1288362 RepID=UPI0013150F98|nr:AbfB domain-containing protein [Actinoplanes sp. ATCC 53533]